MDSPKAKEWLSKLQYYPDTSSFKMSGVSEAFRILLSTGFTPDQAMKILKEEGDVSASTTFSSGEIPTLGLAPGMTDSSCFLGLLIPLGFYNH